MTAIINEAGLEERERQRSAEALVGTECAQLRAELDQRRRADFEAIVEAVVDCSNDVLDQVEALTKQIGAELLDKIDSNLAALQARVDGVLPDTKGTSRFALERDDEASELPNPLPPRRAIN